MRRPSTWTVLALLGLVALAMVVVPDRAYACSCRGISAQRALAQADAAFIGTVTSVQDTGAGVERRRDIRFEVSEVYKGRVFATQVVASDADPESCGLVPQVGSEWTIFATEQVVGSGNTAIIRLRTGLCSGNLPAQTAPGLLRNGRQPIAGESDRAERAVQNDARVTRILVGTGIGGLAALGLLGVGLGLVWRRRRP